MSLGCTVIIYPTVKRYTPDVLWYRDSTYTPEVFFSASFSIVFNDFLNSVVLIFFYYISRVTLYMETIVPNTEGPYQNHIYKCINLSNDCA